MTRPAVLICIAAVAAADAGADGPGRRLSCGVTCLKFSRDDEREADRVGVQIMRRAGWDSRGMLELMETLRRQQGRNPISVQVFPSSHPAPGERAEWLRKTMRASGRRDSTGFQRIKARVQQLPPAKAMPR